MTELVKFKKEGKEIERIIAIKENKQNASNKKLTTLIEKIIKI